jgi:hypothetical protein
MSDPIKHDLEVVEISMSQTVRSLCHITEIIFSNPHSKQGYFFNVYYCAFLFICQRVFVYLRGTLRIARCFSLTATVTCMYAKCIGRIRSSSWRRWLEFVFARTNENYKDHRNHMSRPCVLPPLMNSLILIKYAFIFRSTVRCGMMAQKFLLLSATSNSSFGVYLHSFLALFVYIRSQDEHYDFDNIVT